MGNGLKWGFINDENMNTVGVVEFYRAPVPSGWLVKAVWYNGMSITFVPDVDHSWLVD